MTSSYLKLYCVAHQNVWPYERILSVTPVDRKAPAALTADTEGNSTYRFYRRHPDQFVEIAPMEAYNESCVGASGPEISPYQIIPDRPLAFQIDYVVFRSWRSADYEQLQQLIDCIKKGGLDALDFPDDLRPARAILNGDDESHPWQSRRLEGIQPPARPTSAFIILERSDLPYINGHTIPEGIDYQYVDASVVTYDFYEIPPTYDELMNRLDLYCSWFEKMKSVRSTGRPKRRKGK